MNKKLNDKYLYLMREQALNEEYEDAHWQADVLLCKLLKELGYDDVVAEFEKVGRWYS